MEKILLSESAIFYDSIKHASQICNKSLKEHLTKEFAAAPKKNNRYGDVSAPTDSKYVPWVVEQFSQQLALKKKVRVYNSDCLIQLHKPGQTSIRRNHIDPYNLHKSPDYVLMYCVQGTGDLNIEYSNHRDVNPCWTMPFEPSKYIMWNSSLDYWFSPNEDKDQDRIILLYSLHSL